MNVKKEVFERIVRSLERELDVVSSKLRSNIYEFRKLEKEQTILKREKVELYKMLKELRPTK